MIIFPVFGLPFVDLTLKSFTSTLICFFLIFLSSFLNNCLIGYPSCFTGHNFRFLHRYLKIIFVCTHHSTPSDTHIIRCSCIHFLIKFYGIIIMIKQFRVKFIKIFNSSRLVIIYCSIIFLCVILENIITKLSDLITYLVWDIFCPIINIPL